MIKNSIRRKLQSHKLSLKLYYYIFITSRPIKWYKQIYGISEHKYVNCHSSQGQFTRVIIGKNVKTLDKLTCFLLPSIITKKCKRRTILFNLKKPKIYFRIFFHKSFNYQPLKRYEVCNSTCRQLPVHQHKLVKKPAACSFITSSTVKAT